MNSLAQLPSWLLEHDHSIRILISLDDAYGEDLQKELEKASLCRYTLILVDFSTAYITGIQDEDDLARVYKNMGCSFHDNEYAILYDNTKKLFKDFEVRVIASIFYTEGNSSIFYTGGN